MLNESIELERFLPNFTPTDPGHFPETPEQPRPGLGRGLCEQGSGPCIHRRLYQRNQLSTSLSTTLQSKILLEAKDIMVSLFHIF